MRSPGSSVNASEMYDDERRDVEDHVRGGPVLPERAVHPASNPQCLWIGDLVCGDDPRPDGAERVEALAAQPLVAEPELGVARGDVVGAAVPGDVRKRAVLGDATATRADDHAELGLVIEVVDLARTHDIVERSAHGRRQLGEEDRTRRDVVAELLRVLCVVPAGADDLPGARHRGAEDVQGVRGCGARS